MIIESIKFGEKIFKKLLYQTSKNCIWSFIFIKNFSGAFFYKARNRDWLKVISLEPIDGLHFGNHSSV